MKKELKIRIIDKESILPDPNAKLTIEGSDLIVLDIIKAINQRYRWSKDVEVEVKGP